MLFMIRLLCSRILRSNAVSPDDWGSASGRGTVAPVVVTSPELQVQGGPA